MLPRLRFVVAAALIAALPWFVVGSGLLTTAQQNALSEFPRQNSAQTFATSDLRDAHHMHIMAYVRRSRELSKLRELGEMPLSDWVAAPSGRDEPANPAAETGTKTASLPPDTLTDSSPAADAEVSSAAGEEPARSEIKPDTAEPSETMATTIRPIRRPPLPRAKPSVDPAQPRIALLPPDPVAQEPTLLDLILAPPAPAKSEEPAAAEPAPAEATSQPPGDVGITASIPPSFTPPLPRPRLGDHQRRRVMRRYTVRPVDPFAPPPARSTPPVQRHGFPQ